LTTIAQMTDSEAASAAACLKPVAAVNERAFIIQDDGVEQPAGFDIEGKPLT
jgi:hypothetical protein